MTRARLLLVVVGAAVVLGAGGRLLVRAGMELPHGDAVLALGRAAKALGAPWLAAAWGLGAIAGSRRDAVLAGGTALALGTVTWYVLTLAVVGRAATGYVIPVATAWALVAGLAGGAFAYAGAVWRDGGPSARAASAAVLAGALAGEAVLLGSEWSGRAAHAVLALELGAALGVLALVRRRVPFALTVALFALTMVALAGIEDTARDALRVAGWAGP
jgi:hypothetical protein